MNFEDHTDITPEVARREIDKAESGDSSAVLRLLDLFIYAVQRGEVPSMEILNYLATRFEKIVDDPTKQGGFLKAFSAPRPSNRQRDKGNDERDEALAVAVDAMMKDGNSLEEAVFAITDSYPKFSEYVVRHAWQRYRRKSPLITDSDPIPE